MQICIYVTHVNTYTYEIHCSWSLNVMGKDSQINHTLRHVRTQFIYIREWNCYFKWGGIRAWLRKWLNEPHGCLVKSVPGRRFGECKDLR